MAVQEPQQPSRLSFRGRSNAVDLFFHLSTSDRSSCRTSAAAGSESAAAGSWVLLVHMYDTYIEHAHTRRA